MKKLNIAASGFPGTTKTLRFINEMVHEPLSAIAELCGEKTIIYGVEDNGKGNYTDGWIAVSGELYYFKGGIYNDKVTLYKNVETAGYNVSGSNVSELPAYIDKIAKFGSMNLSDLNGISEFNFSELTRLKSLKNLNKPATENNRGLIEIATQSEFYGGIDDEKAITTKKLHDSSFIRRVAIGTFTIEFNTQTPIIKNVSPDVTVELITGVSAQDNYKLNVKLTGSYNNLMGTISTLYHGENGLATVPDGFQIVLMEFTNDTAVLSFPKFMPNGSAKVCINFLV